MATAGCLTVAPEPPADWQSVHGRDHPLAGRIWDPAAGRFVSISTLLGRLAGARFVLLGESHDNPDHHRLQAWILRSLAAAGLRPAVAFEMLSAGQAPALARHLAASPRDAAGLGPAVGWERSGWPPWAHYQPIAEAALERGLPIVAADLPEATRREVRRDGVEALDRDLLRRTGLDRPQLPDRAAAQAAEIRQAHCDALPERAIPAMVAVQRARDAWMADRLAATATPDGAVLIAGASHGRRDRGVPAYLAVLRPGARVVSLAFVEVRPERTAPEAYLDRGPFDYLWFTPQWDPTDPCLRFWPAGRRPTGDNRAP